MLMSYFIYWVYPFFKKKKKFILLKKSTTMNKVFSVVKIFFPKEKFLFNFFIERTPRNAFERNLNNLASKWKQKLDVKMQFFLPI